MIQETQIIGNSDYTDEKGYELVLRCANNELIWGFYRNGNIKGTINDSQFDVCYINSGDNWLEIAEEKLQIKFKCYDIYTEKYLAR
jgi:hypothetical protein